MDIGQIVTPNTKGQVVIPQKVREALGINENTPLQVVVSGSGVALYPVARVLKKGDYLDERLAEILDRTRGLWADDKDWEKREKKRKRIEVEASKKRRKAW